MSSLCPSCDLYFKHPYNNHTDHLINGICTYTESNTVSDVPDPSVCYLSISSTTFEKYKQIGISPKKVNHIAQLLLIGPYNPTRLEINKFLENDPHVTSVYTETEMDDARLEYIAINGRKPTKSALLHILIKKHKKEKKPYAIKDVEHARINIRNNYMSPQNIIKIAHEATIRCIAIQEKNAIYIGTPATGSWKYVPQVNTGSIFAPPPGLTCEEYKLYLKARCKSTTLEELYSLTTFNENLSIFIRKLIDGKCGQVKYQFLSLSIVGVPFQERLGQLKHKNIMIRSPRKNQPNWLEYVTILRNMVNELP